MFIIRHKYIFLACSGIMVLASIAAIAFFGFTLGIEFTGGSLLEVEYTEMRPSVEEARAAIADITLEGLVIQPSGAQGLLLRFKNIDEATHQEIISRLAAASREHREMRELRFDSIGATIGRELRNRSILALALAGAFIVLYITWAFRHVSRPVSSWKYGVAAVLALGHDVLIPTGVFAVLGYWYGVEIDSLFITALLTIMGFSVHDTIVVFDRTRENLRKTKSAEPYAKVVGMSVRETFGRSVATSCTVMLVLVAIFLFGGDSTIYFALALIIGIGVGTYSSIFVASPILVVWHELLERRRRIRDCC